MARKTTEQVIRELEALGAKVKPKPKGGGVWGYWRRGCIRRDGDMPGAQWSKLIELWEGRETSVDDAIRIAGVGPGHVDEARRHWAAATERRADEEGEE